MCATAPDRDSTAFAALLAQFLRESRTFLHQPLQKRGYMATTYGQYRIRILRCPYGEEALHINGSFSWSCLGERPARRIDRFDQQRAVSFRHTRFAFADADRKDAA